MYLAKGGTSCRVLPSTDRRASRYPFPKHKKSKANCSNAARDNNGCGINVLLNKLRLNINPECRCTLAPTDRANPSSDNGGSYHRPLNQHSR
ncbi:hypothetical protein D3C87_1668140 [compost metagenome]